MFSDLARLYRRALARMQRNRLDEELDEEIRLHLEVRRDRLIADGMDPREAAGAARRSFGNPTRVREDSREFWSFSWLDTLEQDLRYGLRLLRRAPGFTAIAVLSLALGIGAAAAVFNVVDAVLLRTLPVRAPEELRHFTASLTVGAAVKHVNGMNPVALDDFRRAADFADVAGFQTVEDLAVATGNGAATHTVRAECVTDNYFHVLGVVPTAGRLLSAEDTASGVMPVVLSERLASAVFGAPASAVNVAFRVNDLPAVVVGISGDFRGVSTDRPADLFVPLRAAGQLDPRTSGNAVRVIMRLAPGITPAAAEQRTAGLYAALGPSMVRGGELRVTLPEASRGVADRRAPLTRPLTIALVLAGVLLIVSCANTGGLLLARCAAREDEFAVRVAIGAGRSRLLQQIATEAALYAALGGAGALAITAFGAPILLQTFDGGAARETFDVRFDWRVIAFTTATAGFAALVAASVSLFRLDSAPRAGMASPGARTFAAGQRRTTGALLVCQVACSLTLMVAAAAMMRTVLNLRDVDPGFDSGGAFSVQVDTTGLVLDPAARAPYFQRLHDRLASTPDVSRVSLAQLGLMTGAATTGTVDIPGFVPAADEERWVRMFFVGPDFFEAAGMAVVLGRGITRRDAEGHGRVAVVNERFARRYFGSPERAIGRNVNGNVRIVGVVRDARYDSLRDESARAMFIPFTQAPSRPAMTFVVRWRGDRTRAAAVILEAVRMHDPQLRVRVTALSDQVRETIRREQVMAVIATVLSDIAIFLACVGLYAAVSYGVARRRSEFAVRIAIGASGRDIARMVIGEPLKTVLVGVAVGVPGGYAVVRAASSLLYGVGALDPLPFIASTCLLIMAAASAALGPAWRAARTDPIAALRTQ